MYAVVESYNNPKSQYYYKILHIYDNLDRAKKAAFMYAKDYFINEQIFEDIEDKLLYIPNCIIKYSLNYGYNNEPVWAVVKLPDIVKGTA